MTQMLNLNLNVDETNTVLKALSSLPYGEVASIIHSIKTQGDKQVAPPVTESNETTAKPEQLNG